VGDALSRLGQDTSIVGQSLSENLGEGLKAVLGAGAGIGAMYLISPSLTLVMLFVIPPISIGSFYYGRYIRKLSLKTQEALGNMSKLAEERLSAHRTVSASNTQPSERVLFATKVDGVFKLQKKETVANGIFQGGNEVMGDLGMIGLLLYGGVLVRRGEISVGDMTALFIYVNWIEWSLNSESLEELTDVSARRLLYRSHEGCGSIATYHRPACHGLPYPSWRGSTCAQGQRRTHRAPQCQIRLPLPPRCPGIERIKPADRQGRTRSLGVSRSSAVAHQ
jgi:ABC-type multidrug transport system fused ATPase/permease subunit